MNSQSGFAEYFIAICEKEAKQSRKVGPKNWTYSTQDTALEQDLLQYTEHSRSSICKQGRK